MKEMGLKFKEVVNLRRGILGIGLGESVHACAENCIN